MKPTKKVHNKSLHSIWLPVMLLFAGCWNTSSSSLAEQYPIRYAVKPVKVDGKLESGEWDSVQEISPVQVTSDAGAEKTSIRLLYDKDFLYLGVRCADSQITERTRYVTPTDYSKNDSVYVRIVIGGVGSDDPSTFSFSAIPHGLVSAGFHKGPRSPKERETLTISLKPLPPDLYKGACALDGAGWSMELSLSWSAVRPFSTPPTAFYIFVERRNINGDKVEVAEWPYDKKVEFLFNPPDNKEAPTVTATDAIPLRVAKEELKSRGQLLHDRLDYRIVEKDWGWIVTVGNLSGRQPKGQAYIPGDAVLMRIDREGKVVEYTHVR